MGWGGVGVGCGNKGISFIRCLLINGGGGGIIKECLLLVVCS